MIVASPVRPVPRPHNASFKDLVDAALTQLSQLRQTPDYALQSGVCMYTLVSYAAGCCPAEDRQMVHHWLTKMPWTMQVVVALVKGARNPDSIASNLLQQARENQLPDEDGLLSKLKKLVL
jgi:hypothetical protein